MIYALLLLLIIITLCILRERRHVRLIIYMGTFALLASMLYFFFGSPDLAMAEAAIGAFTTIFFVICFEKYDDLKVDLKSVPTEPAPKQARNWKRIIAPIVFTAFLFALFLYFVPSEEGSSYLKEQYLALFMDEIGGTNAVTAIYLGYRVYDTLFEALILIVSVIAVIHMSYSEDVAVDDGRHSDVERSIVVNAVMHIIPAVILLFGLYLTVNGHISAGGGFQGGLFIAAFFVCRYLIYDVFDLPIRKAFRLEEFIFSFTVVFVIFVIFLGALDYFPPVFQEVYMIVMNLLIGLKVACGFIILFYRYIAIERR